MRVVHNSSSEKISSKINLSTESHCYVVRLVCLPIIAAMLSNALAKPLVLAQDVAII